MPKFLIWWLVNLSDTDANTLLLWFNYNLNARAECSECITKTHPNIGGGENITLPLKDFNEVLQDQLRDPEFAVQYLKAVHDEMQKEGDKNNDCFLLALRNILRVPPPPDLENKSKPLIPPAVIIHRKRPVGVALDIEDRKTIINTDEK